MITENYIKELLRLKGGRLYHREGQELEFKEQFNLAGLAEYFRDFAAFSNNHGGYLIFGVKDAPRVRVGMSAASQAHFEKIDAAKITGFLLEIFSSSIVWERATVSLSGKKFGVFRIHESLTKPVIARKDDGKDNVIKNGEIYFRYGGRTQKILFAELENIINNRISRHSQQWLELMTKIGRIGPQNAALLDMENGLIEKDKSRVLVLDKGLVDKLKFIKEGEFFEKEGAATLKLIGDVIPLDKVEVLKHVKEHLTKSYPLSAMEVARAVQDRLPNVSTSDVWNTIAENKIKNNADYSAYNFRNRKQEKQYSETGKLPSATPSIYNSNAVDLIVRLLLDDG